MNFHPSSSWMHRKPSALSLSWWNKIHVQLEMGYVNETEMNVLTRELLLLSCSKEKREKEREVSWIQTLSKNPMKTREQSLREFWERVSEWELSVRAQNSPLGLYLKGECLGTMARSSTQWSLAVGERWHGAIARWGRPTLGFDRPPWGAPGWHPWPRCSPTALCFEELGARPNFVSKDVQNYFSKDFNALKYFWIFVKTKKC